MASGRLVDYLGHGNIADRPATPDLSPDALGVWWSDDTSELSLWDGSAWQEDVTGGAVVADDVSITDTGGYFTGTDVEAALQELGAAGGGITGDSLVAFSIYNKIVAWYEYDEPSGTTVEDAHADNLDGTYTGATVNQTGLFTNSNKSVQLTANTDKVSIAHNARLSLAENLSVIAGVKANGAQGNYPKFAWKSGVNDGAGQANYMMQQDNVSNSGKVVFRVTAGGSNYDVMSTTALADVTPYFLVGTRKGSNLDLYVNAVREGMSASGPSGALNTASGPLYAGAGTGVNDAWIGWLDIMAVFNDALTPQEITWLYNSGDLRSYASIKTLAGF